MEIWSFYCKLHKSQAEQILVKFKNFEKKRKVQKNVSLWTKETNKLQIAFMGVRARLTSDLATIAQTRAEQRCGERNLKLEIQ